MPVRLRKFLAGSVVVGGASALAGGFWLVTSKGRPAAFFRERIVETRRRILRPATKPKPADWPENQITVALLGHAALLINFYGVTVLTDPAFSDRVGIDLGVGTLGPKRFLAPALSLDELPPVDVLLLTHAHMDHLDLPTLRRLKPAFAVTAAATRDLLAATPFAQATELRWGETTTFRGAKGGLRMEAFQGHHWGARMRTDTYRGYNGYLLEREGRKLLFAGDTALSPRFKELRPRGPFDAAIMPIAAYRPWIRYHCTPEEAVQMADAAGARKFIPFHHETFRLSDEPMTEPLERLETALAQESGRLALRHTGETAALG